MAIPLPSPSPDDPRPVDRPGEAYTFASYAELYEHLTGPGAPTGPGYAAPVLAVGVPNPKAHTYRQHCTLPVDFAGIPQGIYECYSSGGTPVASSMVGPGDI